MTTTATAEPSIPLPTLRMLGTVIAAATGTGLLWAGLTFVVPAMSSTITEGALGAGVVAFVSILGVLVMRPSSPRPISSWVNTWLAATLLRLVLTPVLAYLLYTSTALGLVPLMLSVAVTYMTVQTSEAAALSLHLKQVT